MRSPTAMRIPATALGLIICLVGTAHAGDGVTVTVMNDTPDNLTVTIIDRDAHPPQAIVRGEVINGNASISVSITADASGRGHLSWTASTTDPDMRRCGRRDRRGVNDGATIHVSANGRCPAT